MLTPIFDFRDIFLADHLPEVEPEPYCRRPEGPVFCARLARYLYHPKCSEVTVVLFKSKIRKCINFY